MRSDTEDSIRHLSESDFNREDSGLRSAGLLDQVLSSIACRVFAIDRKGNIIFANRAGVAALGLSEEKLIGSHWQSLGISSEITDPIISNYETVLETGREVRTEMSFFWVAGLRDQEMIFSPIYQNGKVEGVVITALDITERKAAKHLSDALNEINLKINSSRDLDEILRCTAEGAKKALGAENCYLLLHERGEWVVNQAIGPRSNLVGLAMRDSIIRALFGDKFDKRIVAVHDIEAEKSSGVTFNQDGFGASIASPFKVKKKVYGIVAFDFSTPMEFKPYHYDFLDKLSTALGFVILNARLQSSHDKEKLLLEAIIESAPIGVALLNAGTLEAKWINSKAISFAGEEYLGTDVRGLPLQTLIPRVDELGLTALVRSVVESGRGYTNPEYEYEHLARGKTYWSFSIIPIDLGDEKDVLIILSDITEQVLTRKRIEELARSAEHEKEYLRAVLSTMPAGGIVTDAEGNIIVTNDMFCQAMKRSGMEMPTHCDAFKVFKPKSSNTGLPLRREEWSVTRALKKGETTLNEMIDIETPNGKLRCVALSATPMKDVEGRVVGCIAVVQDISGQRRVEHEALEAKERAELYLSVMGHEIDNLGTVACGYLDMLKERAKLTGLEANLLEKSKHSLDSIQEIVQTIRNLRKADSESLQWGLLDLDLVIRDSIDKFGEQPGRNINISYDLNMKKMIVASELIQEVFDNIIGNAIKHSSGDISVKIAVSQVYDNGREYHKVSVEDDGPGIPDEMKLKIFSRLRKGNKSGGTLGLYLVKRLVTDFHGQVWVEDRVQGDHRKGAKFVVLLPVAQTRTM